MEDDIKPLVNTSAADKSIGFDYQFYYFFFLLLNLKIGETIGLEVKDDIHVDLPKGKTIYIQTKHTVQTRADGTIINLTERDSDLWKTLSLWIDIANSKADKKAFFSQSLFQLITNKSNTNNPFLVKVQRVQSEEDNIDGFQKYLEELIDGTKDEAIKAYMMNVKSLSKTNLLLFLTASNLSLVKITSSNGSKIES